MTHCCVFTYVTFTTVLQRKDIVMFYRIVQDLHPCLDGAHLCGPPNKPLAMHQCDSVQSFSTPAKSLGCSLEVNPSSSSQEVCELHCFLHDLVNAKKKSLRRQRARYRFLS